MIDMHCHILPDLDDGAKNMEMSLDMLRQAALAGTTTIVATPHVIGGDWLPAWDTIVDSCARLQELAHREGTPITLYPGAEVGISYDILELIKGPGPYCLNGGQYLLVELPSVEIPHYINEFFFTLQTRGVIPILAHPERHPAIVRDPSILVEWVRKGILVQCNAPSIAGKFRERVQYSAEVLLRGGMVHCIGSDAHSNRSRNPDMTEAVGHLQKLVSEERAKSILERTPNLILKSSNDLELPEPILPAMPREGTFFKKLIKAIVR